MAEARFRALSNIEHGEEEERDGQIVNVVYKFPYGAVVSGLSKKVMKELWDLGVLEQLGDAPMPTVQVTTTVNGQPVEAPAGTDSAAGSTPAAPVDDASK